MWDTENKKPNTREACGITGVMVKGELCEKHRCRNMLFRRTGASSSRNIHRNWTWLTVERRLSTICVGNWYVPSNWTKPHQLVWERFWWPTQTSLDKDREGVINISLRRCSIYLVQHWNPNPSTNVVNPTPQVYISSLGRLSCQNPKNGVSTAHKNLFLFH